MPRLHDIEDVAERARKASPALAGLTNDSRDDQDVLVSHGDGGEQQIDATSAHPRAAHSRSSTRASSGTRSRPSIAWPPTRTSESTRPSASTTTALGVPLAPNLSPALQSGSSRTGELKPSARVRSSSPDEITRSCGVEPFALASSSSRA